MAEKAAAQSMIGDVGRFQQVAMGEAMAKGNGGGTASDMAGMAMGMAMGQQMAAQMAQAMNGGAQTAGTAGGTGARDMRRSGSEFLPQLRYEDERRKLLPQLRTEAGIRAEQKFYQKSSDRKNNEETKEDGQL